MPGRKLKLGFILHGVGRGYWRYPGMGAGASQDFHARHAVARAAAVSA